MTLAPYDNSGVELVDPDRLASGRWCHRAQKTLGQGDISASYSADRIGMSESVRKPFSWKGGQWVCVSIRTCGDDMLAEAYRLTHPQVFDGEAVTYRSKTANSAEARADPCGFYHGMRVKHAGAEFVLSGPPVSFAPGQKEQLDLF